MTPETPRKRPLMTVLIVLLAIASIPFVLLGVAGAAQNKRR